MSNECNRENMDITQPENSTVFPDSQSENSIDKIEKAESCEKPEKPPPDTGVAIKNNESESLNSLLVYDSDSSSSSSEMTRLNLNWQTRGESEDSSSSSSSSDSDSDSSEEEEASPVGANKGAIKKCAPNAKTDEMALEQLPPVPDLSKLNLSVEEENFVHMGNVLGVVDKLVTVAALPNTPAYDLDTLLFLENGKRPLGFVFDVLGQVSSPIYAIRFNSTDDIKNLEIAIGTKVYSAPKSKHTQYVFLQQLLKYSPLSVAGNTDRCFRMKGSDASWVDDAELPEEFADYSDDENECFHRFGNKKVSPHVKRTHSSENYKKFENTMNRRNILNTKLNKYMDSYKQARINKSKSKRAQAQTHGGVLPVFDPSVPPPNLGPQVSYYGHMLPPEYAMMYEPASGNNNQSFSSFFRDNFVSSFTQANSANYYFNHPGPSHQ